MINLLPQEQRNEIMYARRNTKLLRWVIGLSVAMALMVVLWGIGYFYIAASTASYRSHVEEKRQALKSEELTQAKDRIQNFSNNIKLVLAVLSQQVVFSDLFREIGSIMPPGTVLSTIEINEVEGGIDLTVKASNYNAATQTQVNLEDPSNTLFEKVDIISVNCGGSGEYRCTANLRALFKDDNPFLFLNRANQNEDDNE